MTVNVIFKRLDAFFFFLFFWITKVCNFRSFSTFVPFRFDFFDTPLLFKVTNCHTKVCCLHKQPPEVFCKKRCSEKFCKFHMKACSPVTLLKRDSNKSVIQSCEYCKILRIVFSQSTSGGCFCAFFIGRKNAGWKTLTEAVTQRCSLKKEILQNLQENTCVGVSF